MTMGTAPLRRLRARSEGTVTGPEAEAEPGPEPDPGAEPESGLGAA